MQERPYEKLIAWKEAYALCLSIYSLIKNFPSEEKFELIKQMRRAAYSIPLNIAEGNAKRSAKEKRRFFEIAHGSLEELHCQLRLSCDLGYMNSIQHAQIDQHLQRVSYLIIKLRSAFVG